MKHNNCYMCELMNKVFGFRDCSQVTVEMSNTLMQLMKSNIISLVDQAQEKYNKKQISAEDLDSIKAHLLVSIASTSAMLVGMSSIDINGPTIHPQDMLILVAEKLKIIVDTNIKIASPNSLITHDLAKTQKLLNHILQEDEKIEIDSKKMN